MLHQVPTYQWPSTTVIAHDTGAKTQPATVALPDGSTALNVYLGSSLVRVNFTTVQLTMAQRMPMSQRQGLKTTQAMLPIRS